VAVEIESYRPFFILGEVAAPGQYPYLPNMTARFVVPSGTPLSPGDTVLVGERGF
jgi:polysaccharide export outer membrane protein